MVIRHTGHRHRDAELVGRAGDQPDVLETERERVCTARGNPAARRLRATANPMLPRPITATGSFTSPCPFQPASEAAISPRGAWRYSGDGPHLSPPRK